MLPNPKNKRDERDNTETTMDIQGYFVTLQCQSCYRERS